MVAKAFTDEQIIDGAKELIARGEKPTTIKVHKLLGSGGYERIGRVVKNWQNSQEARDAHIETLPAIAQLPKPLIDDAEAMIDGFTKKLWKAANELSDAKIEEERLALKVIQDNAEESIKDAVEYAEHANNKRSEAEALIEKLELSTETLTADLGVMTIDRDNQSRDVARLNSDINQANTQLNTTTEIVFNLKTQASLDAQSVKNANQATAKGEKALTEAKKTHDAIANNLIDSNGRAEKQYQSTIADLKADKTSLNQAKKDAVSDLNKAHKEIITELNKDKKSLEEEVAALKAELEKIKIPTLPPSFIGED